MTENQREFMRRLAQLTKETGVAIYGCGCCGSPSLVNVEDGHEGEGYATHAGSDVRWATKEWFDGNHGQCAAHGEWFAP